MHALITVVLLWSGPAVAAENSGELGAALALGTASYGNTLLFGGLLTAGQADAPGKPPLKNYLTLLVPAVGPFWAIHTLDARAGDRRLLWVDGIVQTTALSLLVVGIVRGPGPKESVAFSVGPTGTVRFSGRF